MDVVKSLPEQSFSSKIYMGSSGAGFLSCCTIPIVRYWYHRTGQRVLTLFTFLFSQAVLFFKLLFDRTIETDALLYINTLLPFGAALYGRLTGRKVIYHLHEISITPAPLKYMLTEIARKTSSLNLYVSEAHIRYLPIAGVPARRIYNSLDADFIRQATASAYVHRRKGQFNILMISSLRDYKGVPNLLILANDLLTQTDIRFDLVVNDDQAFIEHYGAGKILPANLTIHARTSDVAVFYGKASLVLNLSRPDQCVETFGMTILEAMAFGIPVIVPPVGGPAELIADGVHGFCVDSCNRALLRERVLRLSTDPELCLCMSAACRHRAAEFSPEVFSENILTAIAQFRSKGEWQ